MADYRRFISYMYMYQNGKKDANVGYVKVESKNGRCKLSINIKSYDLAEKEVITYVFFMDKNTKLPRKIQVANNIARGSTYDNVIKTETENVFESGKKLEEMGGVICIANNKLFATEWDDLDIDIVKLADMQINELEIKNELDNKNKYDLINNKDDNNEKDKLIQEKSEKKNNLYEEKIIHQENNKQDIKSIIEEKNMNYNIEHIVGRKEIINTQLVENRNKDSKLKEIETTKLRKNEGQMSYSSQERNSFIKKIFDNYPGMYPFEDDEIIECVKLEPYDIGIFPMDKWILANNSFLLHGFYTYRHLIFARKRTNGNIEYILGVPGIYRDRDKFMAGMFGFKKFKGIRNAKMNLGDFGYWYMDIRL